MLVPSFRHRPEDLRAWATCERMDALNAQSNRLDARIERATEALRTFMDTAAGQVYCGVSWGKDSVVVADLCMQVCPSVPLVWVRVKDLGNPDCPEVRDRFLRMHPEANYHEIAVDETGRLTSTRGFDEAKRRFGRYHISGVRASESSIRRMRHIQWGENSTYTSAPLSTWSAQDVFAYLHRRDLPVHPSYACLYGDPNRRDRLRVCHLGGERGTEFGRREWEQAYYGDALAMQGRADGGEAE